MRCAHIIVDNDKLYDDDDSTGNDSNGLQTNGDELTPTLGSNESHQNGKKDEDTSPSKTVNSTAGKMMSRFARKDKGSRADPFRFEGDGVSFKGKLIGVEAVNQARGDRMCQETMQRLKAIIKVAGEHKQRVCISVSLAGIRISDAERPTEVLYQHPVHRISFISQDVSDSRAFGFVAGSPQGGHTFTAIKTEKAASQVVIALRDLFQVVLEMKQCEMQKARINQNNLSPLLSPSQEQAMFREAQHRNGHIEALNGANVVALPPTPDDPPAFNQPLPDSSGGQPAVADLLDLQSELDTLQQGIQQIETTITSAAEQFGGEDFFGSATISPLSTPGRSITSNELPYSPSARSVSALPFLPPPPSASSSNTGGASLTVLLPPVNTTTQATTNSLFNGSALSLAGPHVSPRPHSAAVSSSSNGHTTAAVASSNRMFPALSSRPHSAAATSAKHHDDFAASFFNSSASFFSGGSSVASSNNNSACNSATFVASFDSDPFSTSFAFPPPPPTSAVKSAPFTAHAPQSATSASSAFGTSPPQSAFPFTSASSSAPISDPFCQQPSTGSRGGFGVVTGSGDAGFISAPPPPVVAASTATSNVFILPPATARPRGSGSVSSQQFGSAFTSFDSPPNVFNTATVAPPVEPHTTTASGASTATGATTQYDRYAAFSEIQQQVQELKVSKPEPPELSLFSVSPPSSAAPTVVAAPPTKSPFAPPPSSVLDSTRSASTNAAAAAVPSVVAPPAPAVLPHHQQQQLYQSHHPPTGALSRQSNVCEKPSTLSLSQSTSSSMSNPFSTPPEDPFATPPSTCVDASPQHSSASDLTQNEVATPDAFADLDPLGKNKPYRDSKEFFQDLKKPKPSLRDIRSPVDSAADTSTATSVFVSAHSTPQRSWEASFATDLSSSDNDLSSASSSSSSSSSTTTSVPPPPLYAPPPLPTSVSPSPIHSAKVLSPPPLPLDPPPSSTTAPIGFVSKRSSVNAPSATNPFLSSSNTADEGFVSGSSVSPLFPPRANAPHNGGDRHQHGESSSSSYVGDDGASTTSSRSEDSATVTAADATYNTPSSSSVFGNSALNSPFSDFSVAFDDFKPPLNGRPLSAAANNRTSMMTTGVGSEPTIFRKKDDPFADDFFAAESSSSSAAAPSDPWGFSSNSGSNAANSNAFDHSWFNSNQASIYGTVSRVAAKAD